MTNRVLRELRGGRRVALADSAPGPATVADSRRSAQPVRRAACRPGAWSCAACDSFNCATVVWYLRAIEKSVSPGLTMDNPRHVFRIGSSKTADVSPPPDAMSAMDPPPARARSAADGIRGMSRR